MIGLLATIASATAPLPGREGAVVAVLQAQDTLTQHFVDSVVVRSPLPDPLVPIVQWIFQKPGWVMAGGIVIGALVATRGARAALAPPARHRHVARHPGPGRQAGHARRRRRGPAAHGRDGRQGVRLHDARQRLLPRLPHLRAQRPGLRPPRHRHLPPGQQAGGEARHAQLATPATRSSSRPRPRSCSTGSSTARTRFRLTPRCRGTICEHATSQGEAKKTWQRIASTAGHRTHLESDSSALKDVACLTCHARTRPPLPARGHDLRPEGLPPDGRGQDQARPDGGPVRRRRTGRCPTRRSSTATPATSSRPRPSS